MQLNDLCNSFKIEENTNKAREIENNLNLREYLDDRRPSVNNIEAKKNENKTPVNQNKNKWERFGGKPPFSYLNGENEDMDDVRAISNFRMKNTARLEMSMKTRSQQIHPKKIIELLRRIRIR
jgi:hypothetical protein